MYFAVDSVVKQGMKVATNLAEIVTLAGFQRSQNFTAYFWTSVQSLIYLTLFAIQDEHLNKYLLIHCLFYNSKQHMLGFIQP